MKNFVSLGFILVLLIIGGCSENKESNSSFKMKQQYVQIINDDISIEMITDSFALLVDGFERRNKESNSVTVNDSVATYNEFLNADIKKAKDSDNKEKYDLLVEIQKSITTIKKLSESGDLLIDKDEKGNYIISDKRRISEENIKQIENELSSAINKYFE